MPSKLRAVIAEFIIVVLAQLSGARLAVAQDAPMSYPQMAPIEQYLMDRDAETALARSAAPESISRDASVLVLTRHGYEIAIAGKTGWVCWVGRGWLGMFDHPEYWSPKVRAAECINPPGARSILPYALKRTELVLAGCSKEETIAALKVAIERRELPPLEPGMVSYMMSKSAYLTDYGNHNAPHLMFFQAAKNDADWGANVANSPVVSANYWYIAAEAFPLLKSFPPLTIYLVGGGMWSDGTLAPHM